MQVWGGIPDLDGFNSSPQPEPFGSSDCGTFSVGAVVGVLNMNCNIIFGVFSFHRLSMFTQPDFQCPLSFSHVRTPLGNLYKDSRTPLLLFLLWGPVLHPHYFSFRVFFGLKTGFTPRGEQTFQSSLLAP